MRPCDTLVTLYYVGHLDRYEMRNYYVSNLYLQMREAEQELAAVDTCCLETYTESNYYSAVVAVTLPQSVAQLVVQCFNRLNESCYERRICELVRMLDEM